MSDGAPTATRAKETTHKQQPAAPVLQGPVALLEETPPLTLSVQRAVADPSRLTPADVLALQRTVGNQAVSQLLTNAAPRPSRPPIQPKLTVGPVGDRYEQEADRVAEQVVNMPAISPTAPSSRGDSPAQRQEEEDEVQAKPLAPTISPLVQRQEEEEEVQMKPLVQRQAEEEEELQMMTFVQRQEEEEELQTKPLVQRQEEEEELQTKPLVQRQEEEEELQAKPLPSTALRTGIQRQEEEEELQAKPVIQRQEEEEELQTKPLVQRQEEEEELQARALVQRQAEEEEELQTKPLVQPFGELRVQRQAEEEEEIQTKPLVQRQEEEEVQARPALQPQTSNLQHPNGSFEASADLEQRLTSQRGGGNPLPDETRSFMEPRFGADFSGVRVHAGSVAAQLNRSVSAQAFTLGQDIYLGEGKSDLTSAQGKQLLAHELTHVVQQTGYLQRVDTSKGEVSTKTSGGVRRQGEQEQGQTRPSPDPDRGPALAASITNVGRLDEIQRVPLFGASAIDYDAVQHRLTFNTVNKDITVADHLTLTNAITLMIGLHVDTDSIEKQLRKYFTGLHMILPFSLVAKQWHQMAQHVQIVDGRRQADEAHLGTPAGGSLLQAGDVFEAYELAGADPHKGGEAPLFLRYRTATNQEKRIMYKPVDLTPERVLYGGQQFEVAQFGGTYRHPTGAHGVQDVYAYMTFLEERGPRNAADVAGIYRSLGEALALGYVYGLRDLHNENYMMLGNRIQWIDLEAMTATFESVERMDTLMLFPNLANKMLQPLRDAIEPGPDQWFKGLRRSRRRAAMLRQLRAVNVRNEIRTGFANKRAAIPQTARRAAKWVTRFVPFPTRNLYETVEAWHDKVDLDAVPFPPVAWAGGAPPWYTTKIHELQGVYSGAPAEVVAMMTAQQTRAAIRRGDIPFFMRRGRRILDETGAVIVHDSTHPRLGTRHRGRHDIEARRTGRVRRNLLRWAIAQAQNYHVKLCNDLAQFE